MNNDQITTDEIIEILQPLSVPWMLLKVSGKSGIHKEHQIIINLHRDFATLLGMSKREIQNQNLDKLMKATKSNLIKKFFENLANKEKSKFVYNSESGSFRLFKHRLQDKILITALIKTRTNAGIEYPLIEKKFRSIFNALGDFVFINAFNGKFLEVNDTALKILAYSRSSFLKLTPRDVSVSKEATSSELPPSAFEQYDEWAQSEQLLFGAELLTKHGKKIPIEARSKIINYDGSEAILTIARDTTERAMFEKRLLNIVMETEEKERRRLSEELHDGLGPLLSSVKLHTDMLINGNLNSSKKDEVARLIKELVSESINNIREISANLMPHVLSNYGLISALKSLISKITSMQPIRVNFEHKEWTSRPEISIEVLIYRVISELLTNTLKHASAENIFISLSSNPEFMNIVYKDDGIGFNSRQKFIEQSGMGLNNILNRIKSQQGTFSLKTSHGKGMIIILKLPVEL